MSVLQNLQSEPFKTGLHKHLSDMMLGEMDSVLEQTERFLYGTIQFYGLLSQKSQEVLS